MTPDQIIEAMAMAIALEDADCFPTMNLKSMDYCKRLAAAAHEAGLAEYERELAHWKECSNKLGRINAENEKIALDRFHEITRLQKELVALRAANGELVGVLKKLFSVAPIDWTQATFYYNWRGMAETALANAEKHTKESDHE